MDNDERRGRSKDSNDPQMWGEKDERKSSKSKKSERKQKAECRKVDQ